MSGDSLDGSTSVVEAGLVQQQTLMELPGTLLGFETTGPAGPAPYEEGVAGREYRVFPGVDGCCCRPALVVGCGV